MAIPAGHVSNVREIITLQGHILEQQAHPVRTGFQSKPLNPPQALHGHGGRLDAQGVIQLAG